jgi:hypothetical protein
MKKTTTSDLALTSRTDLTSAVDAAWDGVGQSFDQFCLIAQRRGAERDAG